MTMHFFLYKTIKQKFKFKFSP